MPSYYRPSTLPPVIYKKHGGLLVGIFWITINLHTTGSMAFDVKYALLVFLSFSNTSSPYLINPIAPER